MLWSLKKAWFRTYQTLFKVAVCFLDWSEPELLSGAGSIKKLPQFIKDKGLKNVLIVTDKGLMGLHLLDGLFESLDAVGVKYTLYDGVQPNPTFDNINEANKLYVENNCDGVIAFGGGSSMDCAKVAAARAVKPNQPIPKMRGQLKIRKKLPPLFAVPTTAGTGSETTLAAVVTNPATHEKYAINDPVLRPKYAVLDPELTVGLPPHITSTTGMDALTHAVEAYIGRSNTAHTADMAEKAVKLIFDNLEKVYKDGSDIQARENMLKGSFYAGVAFTRAYVGYVHAIAHNLGGLYGVPHGLANAVILPYVLDYFGKSAHAPLARLADVAGITQGLVGNEEKAKKFIDAVRTMNKNMNIQDKFDCIKEEDIPTLVDRAYKEGNPLYPVPKIFSKNDFETVIRRLMAD